MDELAEISEDHFRRFLTRKGYITYIPENRKKMHLFDFACTHGKEKFFFCDVKFKRNSIHLKGHGTKTFHGVNVTSFNNYITLAEKQAATFYLVFYDNSTKEVYKVDISLLKDPQYIGNDKIICWDTGQMKRIMKFDEALIKQFAAIIK